MIGPMIGTGSAADVSQHWKLPRRLSEVSALAASPDGRIFTLNDEKAIVYEIDTNSGDIRSLFKINNPALRGDFEGLALLGEDFYLITSRGELHRVSKALAYDKATVKSEVINLSLVDVCEVEGLSAFHQKLFVVCKVIYHKADKHHLIVFKFDPVKRTTEVFFRIAHSDLGLKKMNPSGIAVTEDVVYVISARQRLLTLLRHNGDLIRHYRLEKKYHRQPEGIAVTHRGELLLADEGNGKRGRITLYPSVNDIR